jgi:G6PDH family F420-dependent oxidoreductase
MRIGYGLSAEELAPADMVRFGARAEELGFASIWVSDHFHPWIDRQGHSPFVWNVVGGLVARTERVTIGTGVTCPILRIHPAIIAQAAATSAHMSEGRFVLGVGTGENLNEHVLAQKWPVADERLAMLEEAVTVMRQLWEGGSRTFRGDHYTVENARLYTLPDTPPPVYMSAFGPKAVELAASVADGYVGTSPQRDLLERFDERGGAGKPKVGQLKVCWGPDEEACRRLAFELWPTSGLAGELSQELATPQHFEQAVSVLDESAVESIPVGPDPARHVEALREYGAAGYDEVYVTQIGPDQEGFLDFYAREVVAEFGPEAREPSLRRSA